MLRRPAIFALVLALLCAPPSWAFDLRDHSRITRQAFTEFNRCFPGLISEFRQTAARESDLDEDIDIFRKDFVYSHFYNPYKHLRMRRYDSLVRVGRLQSRIDDDIADGGHGSLMIFMHLGHAIHHLQDMAAPPHVVPVMHNLSDGFEKYNFKGDISSGLSCSDLVASTEPDLKDLLIETAKETLAAVDSAQIVIRSTTAGRETLANVSGEAFWLAAHDDRFGEYGLLGNHYGETSFVERDVQYAVPGDFYALFKEKQLKLAVRATLKALYWLFTSKGLDLAN